MCMISQQVLISVYSNIKKICPRIDERMELIHPVCSAIIGLHILIYCEDPKQTWKQQVILVLIVFLK